MLGKLPVPGRSTILIAVGQGPTALAVGTGGGCLDSFTLIYPFSSLSPCLWETARYRLKYCLKGPWGWSGGAMVLGKLPVPGRPTIWITVGQGPTALAVGAGGGCLDIFTLIYPFSPLSPSLWETTLTRQRTSIVNRQCLQLLRASLSFIHKKKGQYQVFFFRK